jgi:hypothetical protein
MVISSSVSSVSWTGSPETVKDDGEIKCHKDSLRKLGYKL